MRRRRYVPGGEEDHASGYDEKQYDQQEFRNATHAVLRMWKWIRQPDRMEGNTARLSRRWIGVYAGRLLWQFCDSVQTHGHRFNGTAGIPRSEEHTSELQSLMRNSYAVTCSKKKKHHYVLTSSTL